MTAATDTFVAFVDLLAGALDEHEATTGELAARLSTRPAACACRPAPRSDRWTCW